MKLGAAQKQWTAGWRLVRVEVTAAGTLRFALNRDKLRQVRRREGWLVITPINANPAECGLGGRTDRHLRRPDDCKSIRIAENVVRNPSHL